MLQQLLALIVIVFFLGRLVWQRRNKTIASGEFVFWLFFWLAAGLAIISLKYIDRLAAGLGFSGSGIQILLYVAVAILFYLIFRQRLRLAKMEQDLTKIVRNIALDNTASPKAVSEGLNIQNPKSKIPARFDSRSDSGR